MANMLVFLSPLETEVWLSLAMAFIVVTLGVYFIERYILLNIVQRTTIYIIFT